MYSCVKVITPGGTAGGFSDITSVNDAKTGTPFAVRTMINLGGYAAKNVLEYQGPDDSAFHWDYGVMHDAYSGAQGGGICHDFGLKVSSTADTYGFLYCDTWPDIFFGGYIGGYGYISNIVAGSFRINWARRDRNADSRLVLCLGDTDYDVTIVEGINNGTLATYANPQGLLNTPGKLGTAGSGPAVTAAGGSSFEVGFAAKDSSQSVGYTGSFHLGGDDRLQVNGQIATSNNPQVSSWDASSITVSSLGSAGRIISIFCGANVRVKSGRFNCNAADGAFSFDVGVDPRLVLLSSTGQTSGAPDDGIASHVFGGCDPALSQGSYWTGDITNGVSVPVLLGARMLSDVYACQIGHANGGSTTFSNKIQITGMAASGIVSATLSSADGLSPEIRWWAIGVEAVPVTPILKENTGGLDFDTVYQAYIKTRAVLPGDSIDRLGHVRESYLTGRATDAIITLTLHEDFDKRTATDTATLSGTGSLVTKKFEQIQDADMREVQFKLGDSGPLEQLWSLDKLTVLRKEDGEG